MTAILTKPSNFVPANRFFIVATTLLLLWSFNVLWFGLQGPAHGRIVKVTDFDEADRVPSFGLNSWDFDLNPDQKLAPQEPREKTGIIHYPGPFGAKDFALVFSQGSCMSPHGGTLKISAAGRCELRCAVSDPKNWQLGHCKVECQLTAEEQKLLRDALTLLDPFTLNDKYTSGAWDGIWWTLSVRANGKEKHIGCHNRFPVALCQFSITVGEKILLPHKLELLPVSRVSSWKRGFKEDWLEDFE